MRVFRSTRCVAKLPLVSWEEGTWKKRVLAVAQTVEHEPIYSGPKMILERVEEMGSDEQSKIVP